MIRCFLVEQCMDVLIKRPQNSKYDQEIPQLQIADRPMEPYCLLRQNRSSEKEIYLSHDVVSESEITPCNKICKSLVVYRFTGNVMTSITTLRT